MGVSGPCVETTERTHVDDAALRNAEMRQCFARDEEWAARVGFKDGIPLVEGQAFEGCGSEDGCVVDEDVEAAKGCGDLGDCGADGEFGANVTGDGERAAAKSGDGSSGFGGIALRGAIRDSDVSTGLRKGERDGAAQAASAPRDEYRFAGERGCRIHRISLAREREKRS